MLGRCKYLRVVLVSRSDLVDKFYETCCCDRLFGHVVVTGYSYNFVLYSLHE
jgi:hypothetical protein